MTGVLVALSRNLSGDCPVHDTEDGSERWVANARSTWHRLDLDSGKIAGQSVGPARTAFVQIWDGGVFGAFVVGSYLYIKVSTLDFSKSDFEGEPVAGHLLRIDVGATGHQAVPFAATRH